MSDEHTVPAVPPGETAGKDGYGYSLAMCAQRGREHRAYGWAPSAYHHWTDAQVVAYIKGYHGSEPVSGVTIRMCSLNVDQIERLREALL